MPKKHTPSYTTAKPSYVHPSLQSSRSPASSSSSSEPQTVNQRIQQLRREQAPRATPEQRDELTSVVSSRTVPPELRRILHIPEVNAPKPKANTRTRRVMGGVRPPPGPAAPTSWLQTSRHAPAYARKKKADSEKGAVRFATLARVTNEELKRLPPPRSLVHQCLRTFAQHWEELSEYEQHYIPSLPISLKEALLSYLTLYGQGGLDFKSLKILFQDEEGTGTAGWEEVQFLDLSGLLSERFKITDLGKCVKRPVSSAITTVDLASLRVTDDVADSWEEEIQESPTAPLVPAMKLQMPYFSNLSRLSLAKPGQWASWPDLLRISPNLNKITHLSLAHWPRPSMTPNANTTSMISKHTSVSLGGSHFYSDLDDDWHEATNILRRFSKDTYSLQWLDLEGCNWLKALTSHPGRTPTDINGNTEEWSTQNGIPGPDWNDAWRRITYINFFQGWIPSDNQSLQNMPAGIVPVQLLRWLRDNRDKEAWRLNPNETGHAVAEWVNREKVARLVGMEIQGVRKRGEGAWCRIDFGWGGSDEKAV
ncbi:uncharacterized protein J4E84_008634 [Alternaria hordeiaustralica]|uniref:uncharacterized protein n=1 Tax=Alternaria hordeiaustralica TaxID=1187925 RepID=UPI0020C59CCC|nr:uncharacterized protein J4E84_008634 [Alternaria hordeiaustralica]KAI4678815.1 hypothetical protein J4E84_008634 [Alternaria hordeiaustralica]